MRHKSDFPAMSDSMARIRRIADSENESLGNRSNEILKDVALTNKLLRMVNTAHYSHAGGGSIGTVSRAVALVGTAGIRNMAMSLVMLEHMHNKGHARQLKDEFLRALMAGSVADELCKVVRDGEEVFIGAMYQNLGRLLTEFYLPEEASQVREIVAAQNGASHSTPSAAGEKSASVQVLGLSFEELGLGVAGVWGLPENLRRCMQQGQTEPPPRLADKAVERIRWLAHAANELTDALLHNEPDAAQARIDSIAQRYARALGSEARDFAKAAEAARCRLAETAAAMSLQVDGKSPARRMLALPTPQLPASRAQRRFTLTARASGDGRDDSALGARQHGECHRSARRGHTGHHQFHGRELPPERNLAHDPGNHVARSRVSAGAVLPSRRETDILTGRFGLGQDAHACAAGFKVSLKENADLFAVVCNKGADTLISDATTNGISARLPAWFRNGINAPAFLLLPLHMKGSPFGLVYAHKASPEGISLGENELSLLRTLRNQAVMAFKQAS